MFGTVNPTPMCPVCSNKVRLHLRHSFQKLKIQLVDELSCRVVRIDRTTNSANLGFAQLHSVDMISTHLLRW